MARPKEFDRDDVLDRAIAAFSEKGYAGTSTDALLKAMGISRQSLYDTFGDKRALYLAALERYNAESVATFMAALSGPAAPLTALETALVAFGTRAAAIGSQNCLGVQATCEFGIADADIVAANGASARLLDAAIAHAIATAKAAGAVRADVDPRAAARFLGILLAGLKVAARGGADPDTLHASARLALAALR